MTSIDQHPTVERIAASAIKLEWENDAHEQIGKARVELRRAAIMKCFVSYAGTLHDSQVLIDPNSMPNMRRRLVEVADEGLAKVRRCLIDPKAHKDLDDFESSVAALLFILGFEVAHLRGKKIQSDESADLYCIVGRDVLVIECTTKIRDAHNKLGKLIERVRAARTKSIARSIDGDAMYITGVMVVPQVRDEVKDVEKKCREDDIVLLCRAELEAAIEATGLAPDASKWLASWRAQPLMDVLISGLDR